MPPQPARPGPGFGFIILILLIVAGVIGFALYSFNEQNKRQAALDNWVTTQPVNAMILARHPNSRHVLMAHFTPWYNNGGQAGLERGQQEMQQIINTSYMTDFIWTVKENAIQDYIKAQLALLDRLVKLQAGKPGLCEDFFANSALFEQVDTKAGGRIFADYIAASGRLVLSAKDGVTYKMTPQHPNYAAALNAADGAFWRIFPSMHPALSHQQLEQAAKLFDPLRSCGGYAEYLRALLKMETGFQSLHWRASIEKERARYEALRRQRGSD